MMDTCEDVFSKNSDIYNESASGDAIQKIQFDAPPKNIKCQDKTIQARVHYRSKQVSCNIKINKPVVDASCSPIRITSVDVATSPIRFQSIKSQPISSDSSTIISFQQISQSEYEPSSDEKEEAMKEEKNNIQMKIINMTNYLINKNPKVYLGE